MFRVYPVVRNKTGVREQFSHKNRGQTKTGVREQRTIFANVPGVAGGQVGRGGITFTVFAVQAQGECDIQHPVKQAHDGLVPRR
jgi:hypothetical protein